MSTPMRHWGPVRMRRHLDVIEADIKPPHPSVAPICGACGDLLDGFVYAGWLDGLMRWPYLCSGCAADWINLGGRVALRWAR